MKKISAILLALFITIGFLYSFSLMFLDSESEVENEDQTQQVFNLDDLSDGGNAIIIPVKVHLIIDDSGYYTSRRTFENVKLLFLEANRIWSPAGLYFEVNEIIYSDVSDNAIPNALVGNYEELQNHVHFDPNKINVFLSRSLNNINGIALTKADIALVSDRTTVNDYRTTAHELGHLLGLPHVDPSNRLMAKGRNGEILYEEEIKFARQKAIQFLNL